MSAPRKYDEEFRDRAVRMYRDRLAEPGESKLGARRHVGSLLDLNQATLRNWVEERYAPEGTGSAAARAKESEEIRALKKRVAELERANEILKTSAAFSPSTTAALMVRRLGPCSGNGGRGLGGDGASVTRQVRRRGRAGGSR
jgi:transposase-like protein